MKWDKLGQIFVFDKSPFKKDFFGYAQSPHALVLEDRVRVYFSTRSVDEPGKFLSHIQYVDYDKDLKNIIDYSNNEVIKLGDLGCFDEHGIFPLSPLKAADNIRAYTNGISRRVSVAVETAIGYATSSDDGKTFKKLGDGPIMAATINEPFMVGDAFVDIFDKKYHMFYIFGTKWSEDEQSERVYKIGHAISDDGINWQRNGLTLIENVLGIDECQAMPTVIKLGQRYHMYFCYRHMKGFRDDTEKSYRLGYAYSDNLVEWIREDKSSGIDISSTGWDSSMMCYPNVFECNNNVYLLYNGNNFGKTGFGAAILNEQ